MYTYERRGKREIPTLMRDGKIYFQDNGSKSADEFKTFLFRMYSERLKGHYGVTIESNTGIKFNGSFEDFMKKYYQNMNALNTKTSLKPLEGIQTDMLNMTEIDFLNMITCIVDK